MQICYAIGSALQGGLIYDLTGQQGYGSSVFFVLYFVALLHVMFKFFYN